MKVIIGGNQMSLIRDTEEVVKFLEFAGRKSILNEHAINCRLTACNNLFSVLNEDEDNIDYILQNLDVLINRFRNRNNNVRASTLKVYKSRVKSSLEDFKSWSADPFAWERAVTDKARATLGMEIRKERKEKKPSAPKVPVVKPPIVETIEVEEVVEAVEDIHAATEVPAATTANRDKVRKVSFPIRSGFSVEMTLPAEGLTLKELHRLGLFLYPYCNDIDEKHSPWATLLQPPTTTN